MDYRKILKQVLIYAGIVVFFGILSYAYAPQVLSGKVVNQSDTSGWLGMTHEIAEHNAAHPDDKTQWTNSMFGGMPTAAMYDEFKGDWTSPLYKGLMGLATRPVNFFLISLIGAFLLLLACGVNKWLAVAGAVAVTFCSYNLQIIQVGHNTKMQAIAFAPWVLAGIIFTYRCALKGLRGSVFCTGFEKGGADWKSWFPLTVLGAVLFALALSFQVKANHPQISYYLAIIVLIYFITMLIWLCVAKERRAFLGRFLIASALLLVVGGIGIATNLNKLIPTLDYSKYTMRGGSELSSDSDTHNDKGLDLAYATAWSYGVEETPNLLIPNFNGGSSAGELGKNSETYRLLSEAGQRNLDSVMKALPTYWGPQPFTAGPMYMGAITVFLFIFGLCLYRGKEKWWLLVAALIAIFLAWGSHFMWFTRLWFNYVPLYSKFRTVSMSLVALQFILPILGFVVLNNILNGGYERKTLLRGLYIAGGVTLGFCLICIFFPGIAGTFYGAGDSSYPEALSQAFAADRRHLLVSDAWRSFSLVALTAFLLYFLFGRVKGRYSKGLATGTLAAVLCLMMLFDLWGVGKRYLNGSHFVNKRDFTSQFKERSVDKVIYEIEEDEGDIDCRVLDLSENTFNSSFTSYFHKSIGGYSPVKLQRYQDLIDRYLTKEINSIIRTVNNSQTIGDVQDGLPELPVVSMLNTKYIIIGGDYIPVINDNAFGNALFVDEAVYAETPDDELALLGSTDLKTTAVIGSDFKNHFISISASESTQTPDEEEEDGSIRDRFVSAGSPTSDDFIEITSYAPNELHYNFRSATPRSVVFSEIYYPDGWTLQYIPKPVERHTDGEENATAESQASSVGTRVANSGDTTAKNIDIFRANWILRAATLPAGEGELIMRFDPQSYARGERLSRASSITLLLLLLLSLAFCTLNRRGLEVQ